MAPSTGVKPPRKFRAFWALQYALAVAERELETGAPTRAVCLMCRAFARDETAGAKRRKPKTKVHCFSPPWRPDNMRRHLEQQHALRWRQYKELSDEDKLRFFPANVAISTRPRSVVTPDNRMEDVVAMETGAHVTLQQITELNAVVVDAVKRPATFLVDKEVVDELLRAVEGDDAAFDCFEPQEIEVETDDEDLELDINENDAKYVVHVDSELELATCVKFVAAGVSLKQAAQLYQGMIGGITALEEANGECTPTTEKRAMNLCRVACAVNLQTLKDVLIDDVWAFALVLELCKCAGSTFIDVRVRFEHNGEIHSVHLVGIVMLEVQMTDESVDLVVRYLDVIAPQWRTKLIGVSLSNEGGIRARACMQGIVHRLAGECEGPIYGDYNLAVKLNYLLREACRTVLTVEFTNTLLALVSRLRRLRPRYSDGIKCLKLVEESWKCTVRALQWLVANRTDVIGITETSQYVDIPRPEWWVLALVVTTVAGQVTGILKQLRDGKGLSHDRQHVIDLMNHLSMMTGAVGPFIPSDLFSISCEDIVIGSFSLNPVATATFLKAQGNFADSAIDSLQPTAYQTLLDVTSTFVLTVLSRLNQIITESNNDPTQDSISASRSDTSTIYHVPALFPNVLCKMKHQDFVGILQQQRMRLEKRFTSEEIEAIETQHRVLRNAYLLEKCVRDELDRLSACGSFSEAWREGRLAGIECQTLRSFCGALAAVASPVTSSSDSEFLLINWRKIPFSQSITDFSLEAILHSQNYHSMAKFRKY